MNRVIKRYLNSKGELSALVEVIKELDESFAFVDPFLTSPKIPIKKYHFDLLMINIKEELGELIYKKHYYQYSLSKNYSCRESSPEEAQEIIFGITYQVKRDDWDSDKETFTLRDSEFSCSCHLFDLEGIVCRHMFCVAGVRQIKDLSKYLHPRWKIKNYNDPKKHQYLPEELDLIREADNVKSKEEDDHQKVIKFKETLHSSRKFSSHTKLKNNVDNDKEKEEIEIVLPPIQNFSKGIRTKGKKKDHKKRKDPPDLNAIKRFHQLRKGPPEK